MKTTLIALLCTAVMGYCQEPTKPEAGKPAHAETTATAQDVMPVARTLTATDGRTIDAVIISKTATAIMAKRADGKEFEITLDKLSADDRSYIATLQNAPVKKPTLLLIGWFQKDAGPLLEKLNAEFDVQAIWATENRPKFPSYTWPEFDKITDAQRKAYDVVWLTAGWGGSTFTALLEPDQVIVALRDHKLSINDFLKGRNDFDDARDRQDIKPYFEAHRNVIRYCDFSAKWDSEFRGFTPTGDFPEMIDQAIQAAKNLLTNKLTGK